LFFLSLLLIGIFFLLGTIFLTAMTSALRRIHKRGSQIQLQSFGNAFFYRKLHLFFLPNHEYEGIFFAAICSQAFTRFFSIAAFLLFFLFQFQILPSDIISQQPVWNWFFVSLITYALAAFFLGDCLPRVLGSRYPQSTLKISTPIASVFLVIFFPITYLFIKAAQALSKTFYLDLAYEPMAEAQREIIEMIQNVDFQEDLETHDKKLIESVMKFKERIAREVMVPRVDVFCLSAETTIKEAAKQLQKEGYSRTPIYRGTVDNIVGVLMYKDILTKFIEYQEKGNDASILEAPIETIQKNVLHTPETKKISNLLQEFRKKQVHLAIVVDEYGGTEGIVTIEDILEEIVGDISDEYDQEAQLYYAQADGTWVVDARMNIVDFEDEFGIEIPEEGDYDTVGGYIFHTAGAIPAKGFVIHHDDFEMEILQSNDRSVEKVRIKKIKKPLDE